MKSSIFRNFGFNLGFLAHRFTSPFNYIETSLHQVATIGLYPDIWEKELMDLGPSVLNQGAGFDFFTKQDKIMLDLYYSDWNGHSIYPPEFEDKDKKYFLKNMKTIRNKY